MLRNKLRASEYRTLAAEAVAAGAAAKLDHVREKHRLSAERWSELAEADEARIAEREDRVKPAADLPPLG